MLEKPEKNWVKALKTRNIFEFWIFGGSTARAGPAGPLGGPKVVQIVPLGSLTLLKWSGTLKNYGFDYKYYVALFV